ncbi:MAG: ribbon-helix-helix protein, CopG family [Thermodesulfobacteriota bacterium]|jgi:metal-responsive CopG/Arc/MetJ family transcriptional regulator
MRNLTVNISFQDRLLEEIDAEAKRESRTRSELLREAAPLYVRSRNNGDEYLPWDMNSRSAGV